jgi:DNA-binding MarR family transcriptional regulator
MRDNVSPEGRIAGECLAGRVRVLSRVVTGIYDDALRPHKVRVSQMNVLVAVAAMGPVRAGDICRQLRLDKSTLSRDLDRLLDRGWVRANPGAGRSQDLEATPAGRAMIRKVLPAWEEAQARVRGVLGAALTKGLFEAADRLREADVDRR